MQILYADKNSSEIFKELLLKYKPLGLKIHDFEIISIGLANDISNFYTANIKDFKMISEINLIN